MIRLRWALAGSLLVGPASAGQSQARTEAPAETTVSASAESSADASTEPGFVPRRARRRLFVYWHPRRAWPRRARVERGAVISVGARVKGFGCPGGWGPVEGGGYVCRAETEATDQPLRWLPVVEADRVVPFVYAHDPRAPAFNYAYVGLDHDERDQSVLVRPDGARVSAEGLALHAPSWFHGRDLEAEPLAPGTVAAWVVDEGALVWATPDPEAPVVHRLEHHAPLVLEARPIDGPAHWYRVVEGLPPGVQGFVDDRRGVHHWVPAAPPASVGPDELWIDVELSQQVLALRRGPALRLVTLVSAGLPERPTPTGLFRITEKRAQTSMRALPSSPDRYVVEEVPWTMYFYPHYALHGAYWHDEFGRPRSHGCINLAPRDAAFVYARVAPEHAPGFSRIYATDRALGSVVRIRDRGDAAEPSPSS